MKIAYTESVETEYWLLLIANICAENGIEELKDLIIQIKKMLSKIISTSIINNRKP